MPGSGAHAGATQLRHDGTAEQGDALELVRAVRGAEFDAAGAGIYQELGLRRDVVWIPTEGEKVEHVSRDRTTGALGVAVRETRGDRREQAFR